MRLRPVALAVLSLSTAACVVIERPVTVTPCCGDQVETALTTTSIVEDYGLALSLTDVEGPLACALAEDDELPLGRKGTQLFLRVQPGWFLGCEDASFTLGGEHCTNGYGDGVKIGCGRLRSWNSQGELVEEAWAVSGAVIVEDAGFGTCRWEIEAVLPGGEVIQGVAVTEDLDIWGEDASCDEG